MNMMQVAMCKSYRGIVATYYNNKRRHLLPWVVLPSDSEVVLMREDEFTVLVTVASVVLNRWPVVVSGAVDVGVRVFPVVAIVDAPVVIRVEMVVDWEVWNWLILSWEVFVIAVVPAEVVLPVRIVVVEFVIVGVMVEYSSTFNVTTKEKARRKQSR